MESNVLDLLVVTHILDSTMGILVKGGLTYPYQWVFIRTILKIMITI